MRDSTIVTFVVTVTFLLSIGLGWLIVEVTRGEPGLQAWQAPLRISVNSGRDYIFVTWDYEYKGNTP